MSTTWVRATKAHPCPICGKPDWCSVSADGSASCCMRVESEKPTRNGGWLHRLGSELPPERRRRRPVGAPAASASVAPSGRRAPSVDFEELQRTCAAALSWQRLEELAAHLCLAMSALRAIGLGWHNGQTYSLPMHDGGGRVCGLRLRTLAGRKWAVVGSRNGLFLDQESSGTGTVFVCEGASDAVAMLGTGLEAVGVPGAGQCVELLKVHLRKRDVVVMVDRDDAGRRGADRIAAGLSRVCRSVRLLYPRRGNDVRDWFNWSHPTAAAVLAAARARRCY